MLFGAACWLLPPLNNPCWALFSGILISPWVSQLKHARKAMPERENRVHFWFDALKLQLSRLLHSFLGVPSPLYSYTWPPLTVFICNHMFARFLSFLLSFHPVLMPSLSISKSLIRHKNEQWTVINVQQTNKFDEFDAKKKSFSVSLGGCAEGLTRENFVRNGLKQKNVCKLLA